MLAVTSYKKAFIEAGRGRVARQLSAYDALIKDAGKADIEAFAPEFFNNMVLALDHYFMHRQRSFEGKDGNPLNEVRMLAVSLLEQDGVMTRDSTIKYDSGRSVTGIALGQSISISREMFEALADAFFNEIERRYA